MEVNKKQLADIFGASIRTIQNWQEQGMPVLRGGGKGNEVLYDSATVIKWYAERDAEIENEKLRREVEELRQASETDLQPGTIEYERHRLTRAQADAQELKNARDSAEVVETAFCTFVLSRIAGEIASILDGIPLSVQRRFPELENRHVDFLKRDIIKAMNKAAALDELIPGLLQAVLDTEAAVYSGQEAIDAGLADELVNSTDAITVMRDALDAHKSRLSGGRMTKETQSTTVSATASQADVTEVVQATEGENASAAQPDVNAQITAAVAAENSRIMGILNCEEAHGREEQARVLAETPGMTVETARRILAAAPQSAQARSDTALDRLMQGAPAPLAAGNPASDAVNDLLNTPV